ncbi:MAG TPA: class I SAM-dependent methyltransferase [Gemmatimonadaceae bacterium]|nr:class I SAM-dependent methyltransferase [Gemmatimonadaceae bacterium]
MPQTAHRVTSFAPPPPLSNHEREQRRRTSVLSSLHKRLAGTGMSPFVVELPDGTVEHLQGDARAGDDGERARFLLRVRNDRGRRALVSLDEMELGTAYLRGDIDVEGDFLSCLDLRGILTDRRPLRSLLRHVIPLVLGQRRSDMAWVPKHYDFGNEFYWAFLDKQYGLYSQALYTADDDSLDEAVVNKLEYIVDVCRLRRGSHVLNVGGGWASFEKFIAPRGVSSTMLTLSHDQYAFLSDFCLRNPEPGRLEVVRESIFAFSSAAQYDAITLLGVMEHLPDYHGLFARFATLLKPAGRVYMDFAAGQRKYKVSTFTSTYVFPGNHTPVYLPGLFAAAIAHGFEPIALHNDRHSYYLTLQAWARNLEAAYDRVLPIVGERVYRLFRLYLWAGAHQLQRSGSLESYRVVFQRASGRPSHEIGCYKPI